MECGGWSGSQFSDFSLGNLFASLLEQHPSFATRPVSGTAPGVQVAV